MISIGFDPAKQYGLAIYDQDIGIVYKKSAKFTSLHALYKEIRDLMILYSPDVLILAQAAGKFTKTIWQHGKYSGIAEMLCQKKGVTYIEQFDSQLRKAVHGKGRMSKQEVMEATNETDDNIADAVTAARYIDFLNIF